MRYAHKQCLLHHVRGLHASRRTHATRLAAYRTVHGFSLVELMVAMVLGLLVATAAIGIFASHRATYGKTNAVDKLQENARTVFELMARDIRAIDNTACRNALLLPISIAHRSESSYPVTWQYLNGWSYKSQNVNDANIVDISFTIPEGHEVRVVSHEINGTGDRKVTFKGHAQFKEDDRVLICDNDVGHLARIKQLSQDENGGSFTYEYKVRTGMNGTNTVMSDNPFCKGSSGAGADGGWVFNDCSINQGYQPAGLNAPAYVVKLTLARWVNRQELGDVVLYRNTRYKSYYNHEQKIVSGLSELKIEYLLDGESNYLEPDQSWLYYNKNLWPSVRAARIVMELESPHEVGNPNNVKRRFEHVVSLRSRNP